MICPQGRWHHIIQHQRQHNDKEKEGRGGAGGGGGAAAGDRCTQRDCLCTASQAAADGRARLPG
jgi:hypothetical protein